MSQFVEFLDVLAAGAVVLALITSYLVANKLWSRKHEKVVSESISVSAQLIGIFTMLPFLTRYLLIDGDYMSFASMFIRLALTIFYLAIGIGLWVAVGGRENLWVKTKRALRLERKESLDLISALIRPSGARIMLEVMQRLALIDGELDERERRFIQDFADRWNIGIDFQEQFDEAGEVSTEQMYIDLHDRLSDYLSVSPERRQVAQFLDIIDLLVGIDKSVTEEEQFIVQEIRGMLETYINEGEAQSAFSVIVVPQDNEEREAIKSLLPNAKAHARWGGNIYFAGAYHSRGYAELISRKYQALNLFSTVKAF